MQYYQTIDNPSLSGGRDLRNNNHDNDRVQDDDGESRMSDETTARTIIGNDQGKQRAFAGYYSGRLIPTQEMYDLPVFIPDANGLKSIPSTNITTKYGKFCVCLILVGILFALFLLAQFIAGLYLDYKARYG